MIIKSITDLLLDHECVIVPEFGAFISKETPAVLDYVNNRLTPPSKEVRFNGQLITDDGLLIGYVAKQQGISMTAAAKQVHDFAMQSLAVIEASGVLRLDGMGLLSRVTSRDYVFQLDEELNLFGDAFGLTPLKLQPIYRRETYKQIQEQIATEQKAKNTLMTVHDEVEEEGPHHVNRYNYKWFRAAAYSMMIAMVLVLLGWGADKSDSSFASWNPFFYSSPNEFIAKHFNNEAREFVEVAKLPMLELKAPVFKKDIYNLEPRDFEVVKPKEVKPAEVKPAEVQPADVNSYYIIGASLRTEADGERCAKNFQKQGFEGAVALPMNDKGNVRVAYELVMGREAALRRLEIIKTEYNEAAWLLRKK